MHPNVTNFSIKNAIFEDLRIMSRIFFLIKMGIENNLRKNVTLKELLNYVSAIICVWSIRVDLSIHFLLIILEN